MTSSIIGHYLVSRGIITARELEELLVEQQRVKVKLGLIAVAEGLMTREEADRINGLQVMKDRRFGDIAIDEGYLTKGEVEALLSKQENAYLAFAQALENLHLMTVVELEGYMREFQDEYDMTLSDMEDIKSDDIDRILPICMPAKESGRYLTVAGTALRTIMRCVNAEIYIERAYITERCRADNGVIQELVGEESVVCGLAGRGKAFLPIASAFGGETFEEVNEDALDSVGELLNCINGIYASNLSQGGSPMEIFPPKAFSAIRAIVSGEMLVLPLHIMGQKLDFIFSIGNKIGTEQEV